MVMRGRKQRRFIVCGLFLMLGLAGCGNVDAGADWRNGQRGGRQESTEQESTEQESTERESTEQESAAGFGSVPWFRDDSGSNTQLVDGWIYGYWSRQLCRVNADTLESEVLFETKSPQRGIFSIYDGMVYFLEQRRIDYPDGGERANLWRMECDGSGRELLAEGIDLLQEYSYCMEIYDDILYLICSYADADADLYFRLGASGNPEEISGEETLYGMVPEGYQDAGRVWQYNDLPNLVYCVRNFGYCFLCDEDENLYRVIPDTGGTEKIPLADVNDAENFVLTNEALVYSNGEDIWYAMSLDDLEEVAEIGEMECYGIDFWDEKGIYSVKYEYADDSFSLTRLNWTGEREYLDYGVRSIKLRSTSVYGDDLAVLYSDGTYLYYDNFLQGDGVVCRTPLERDNGEAVQVYVYYDNPLTGICTRETFSTTFTVETTGNRGEFSMTKVYLTEESKAAAKINAFLEERYQDEEEYIAGLMDEVRSGWNDGLDTMLCMQDELSASVVYLDDDYIGLSLFWYEYWAGAAHGQYGNQEYVFSRSTGERILLTDMVENSEEEICAIIAPYVEAKADWGTDEEGWERIILEEGRFYLTPEGIGIHFDTYELTCYASGGLDVVVPYELFELRSPDEVGLTSF